MPSLARFVGQLSAPDKDVGQALWEEHGEQWQQAFDFDQVAGVKAPSAGSGGTKALT